jgi:catechol 2,3-dioxygenase-like lactoylglutathione lyase family enzyme
MIDRLDHLVLTTIDLPRCVDFYTRVLGMELRHFGAGRQSLHFGRHKINLHERGREFEPRAHLPVPGALDLCFIASCPLDEVLSRVRACGWPVLEGPGERTGATRPIRSIYLRDPDLNLIEVSEVL